jgi:hypothetical protein
MELLNLRKCKTNQDVCCLRKSKLYTYNTELLNEEVEKGFIYQEPATTIIYRAS